MWGEGDGHWKGREYDQYIKVENMSLFNAANDLGHPFK